jgi:hypothetical protein
LGFGSLGHKELVVGLSQVELGRSQVKSSLVQFFTRVSDVLVGLPQILESTVQNCFLSVLVGLGDVVLHDCDVFGVVGVADVEAVVRETVLVGLEDLLGRPYPIEA